MPATGGAGINRAMRGFSFLIMPLALGACGGGAANNAVNVVNLAVEEGVEDLNSSIEGDQYSPIPEAADDVAGNRVGNVAGNRR